ncbi:MAG: formate dehydrogenase-N subunit alpha [Actinobacteria bacterium]|nr:formate dehydrogenase-N subunit alpha [Actinomycetota bacterium]
MEISRRDFVKISGTGLGAGIIARMGLLPDRVKAGEAPRIIRGKETRSTCQYCGVSCGILAITEDGKITDVEGDPDHPVSRGGLCAKGSMIYEVANSEERLTRPLYRGPGKSDWKEISWDEAMSKIAENVKKTRDGSFIKSEKDEKTGKDLVCNRTEAIGCLGSTLLHNEEQSLLGKLMRALGLVYREFSGRLCQTPTVSANGQSFGRGPMTNHWIDMKNSDCIMVCGANNAETSPVSWRWINEAQKNGGKVIVVDPRFTRSAARADIFAQIRPGTDSAFFSGLVRYALENNLVQSEYVKSYTNASFLINPAFEFDSKAGLFSGFNDEEKKYSTDTWTYQNGPDGKPLTDPTMNDPNCVYQLVKNHFARYTPGMVSKITGMAEDKFLEIAEAFCSTGKPEKSGVLFYSVGLTQQSHGSQIIRAFDVLQLLLGNIGVAGGGINAMAGASNGMGGALNEMVWHGLPTSMSTPNSSKTPTLESYINAKLKTAGNSGWKGIQNYIVSLLKGYWGDYATPGNEFAYQLLPKVKDGKDYSHMYMFQDMLEGNMEGLFCWGQNPAVGGPHADMERRAMEKLKWMVVVDLWHNESSSFWERPGADPGKIDTEVFLLPAAASVEKEGTTTNSCKWVQWRNKAVEPPEEAKCDLWIINRLYQEIKKLYEADDSAPVGEAITELYWPYGDEPDYEAVLKLMNGFTWGDKKQVQNMSALKGDGSTACVLWPLSGVYPEDGNQSKMTGQEDPSGLGLYPKWSFAWPVNRRIFYNRCSADPSGNPWNPEKALVKWDGTKWIAFDNPDFNAKDAKTGAPVPPDVSAGFPFLMLPNGKGRIFVPGGLKDGPLPEHYEPVESPVENAMSNQQYDPVAMIWDSDENKLAEVGSDKYPYAATTCRLVEHWQAGQMTRNLPWACELMPEMFVEIGSKLAKARGIKNGSKVVVESARGEVECVACVTERIQPLKVNGAEVETVCLPWCYGYIGLCKGGNAGKSYSANQLTAHVGDPNALIPEYKAFLVNIRKA